MKKPTYSIHRIDKNGGASWWADVEVEAGEKAVDVLARVARTRAGRGCPFAEGQVFFVVPRGWNGNGDQALFRWGTPKLVEPPPDVTPVSLADLAPRKASWTEG